MKAYDSNYGGSRIGAGRKNSSPLGKKELIRLPKKTIPIVISLVNYLEKENYTEEELKNFPSWEKIKLHNKSPDYIPKLKKMCDELPPSTRNRSGAIKRLLLYVESL